jgi:hypothetical protein
MSQNLNSAVAVTGIDIGKNSFHIVGLDGRGAIAPKQPIPPVLRTDVYTCHTSQALGRHHRLTHALPYGGRHFDPTCSRSVYAEVSTPPDD